MLESAASSYTPASLPYKLLMTWIFQNYSIDLSAYPTVEISTTYDSKTFASMGYILVDDEWCRKYSAKTKPNLSKVFKPISNPILPMLKKLEELKELIRTIKERVVLLQESTFKLIRIGKDTNYDIIKVRLTFNDFK